MTRHSSLFSAALLASALALTACSGDDAGSGNPKGQNPDFVVNEAFAAELIAKGLPEDAARFFAAARLEVIASAPRSFHFLQTFPNGATRDLLFTFGETQTLTPTAEQSAAADKSGVQIIPISHSATPLDAEPVKIELQYFVPYTSMSAELLALLAPASPGSGTQSVSSALTGPTDGVMVIFQETAKEGADAGIGAVLEYFKDAGLKLSALLSSLFSIASALSDITASLDLSKEHSAWMSELDLLLWCAKNPTSPLAQSDPNYTGDKSAKLDDARSELTQLTAARFLNAMTDTASGLNPALSVALKPGLTWNDQTLKQLSEDTVMKEARDSIIPCDFPLNAVFSYTFTNSYEKCDSICHQYDESLKATATFPLTPTIFGGFFYDGIPTDSSFSMSDITTFTDKSALNPPYHMSDSLVASAPPTVSASGGPTTPPEKYIDVTADALVKSKMSSTDMGYLNGTPTAETTTLDVDVSMRVTCKFDQIVSTGGTYFGQVIEVIPFSLNDPSRQFGKGSCSLTLTPVLPAQ